METKLKRKAYTSVGVEGVESEKNRREGRSVREGGMCKKMGKGGNGEMRGERR